MNDLSRTFSGLKILELSSVLAGPLVGSFFAELGADVLKIENRLSNGDVTRTWKLTSEDESQNASAYYHSANYKKKILMLDLTSTEDYEKAIYQVLNADVILTNYQKKTAEKLKIDIDTLKRLKPGLIIVQLNAFDYDDPRAGYDLVMQAEAGYISMTGNKDQLAKMPVAMIDILAAHQMKQALLIALIEKLKTKNGSTVHVSLFHSALSALVNQGTNYLMEKHIASPIGTLHPNIAPYGEISKTRDGCLIIWAIGSDFQFEKLMDFFGIKMNEIPQFAKNKNRVINRSELEQLLSKECEKLNYFELTEFCNRASIPYGNVRKMDEVLNAEEAQNMIKSNNIEGFENGKYISNVAFTIQCN